MKMMMSASFSASLMSWLTKTMVLFSFCCRFFTSSCRDSRVKGSRAEKGLIHQHDGGRSRQGPQHADALLLAAGELRRILVGRLLHVDQLQHLLDDLIAPGLVVLQQLGDHADVLGHGHVGEQADLLDHVADVTAQIYFVLGGDVLAVQIDLSTGGLNEAVDHFQRGGFAAAGRTDEHGHLTVRDLKAQIVQDLLGAVGRETCSN